MWLGADEGPEPAPASPGRCFPSQQKDLSDRPPSGHGEREKHMDPNAFKAIPGPAQAQEGAQCEERLCEAAGLRVSPPWAEP